MRLKFSPYLFPFVVLLLPTLIQSSNRFNITLRTSHDVFHDSIGWVFPKDRPYHYANSTQEIPHNFLPVKGSSLPDGKGVWVLRHKDFSGLPKRFIQDKNIDTSKSVIRYTSQVSIFQFVSIKALAYGDVQLDLAFTNRQKRDPEHQNYEMTVTEKIPLFGENSDANCTSSGISENTNNTGLHWTYFQVENLPTTEMTLEAVIHHPKSFLIIDEISVDSGEGCPNLGTDELQICLEKTKNKSNKLSKCIVMN